MDPVTALALTSVAISGYGAIRQGQAAKDQANYQSTVANQQAERARQQAAVDAEDFSRQQSATMATRRAALGGAGVEAGSGSPLLVSEDFAGEAELGRLRIINGGDVNATRTEQTAALYRSAGSNAMTSGLITAGAQVARGGSLLLGDDKIRKSWGIE